MVYWLVRFIAFCVFRVVYRIKVSGIENIPQEGAFILCSNHIHALDPVILATSIRRQLRIMAKKELFESRLLGGFLRAVGSFPVARNTADMSSYRNSIKSLKSGMGLLIFSQGTRLLELDIKNAKGGAALFAVKAKAPIIPAGIAGSYRFFSSLNIHFGKAIVLDQYYDEHLKTDQIETIMTGIMSEVEKLVT
ncbi:MAG: 1-acyl-sn-glycerol-3-phosphate acyltransferase [Defluviitaleaceae bacterium]|nr:1-acyl-sn-glycerol-3-phosphate acyltransferase [Defluviitaleaceae bacterium]